MTAFIPRLDLYRNIDPTPVGDVVDRLRKQERASDRQPLPISTADSLVIEDGLFKLNTPEGPMPLTLAAARDLGGFVGLQSTTINNLESIGAINALVDAIHVACRNQPREVVVNTTMTRRRGRAERRTRSTGRAPPC